MSTSNTYCGSYIEVEVDNNGSQCQSRCEERLIATSVFVELVVEIVEEMSCVHLQCSTMIL